MDTFDQILGKRRAAFPAGNGWNFVFVAGDLPAILDTFTAYRSQIESRSL